MGRREQITTITTMFLQSHLLTHIPQKLIDILRYPASWLAGLGLFIADAVSGGVLIVYVVIIATTIDLICGIAVSIKRKNFAKSELARLTVEKVVVYGTALLVLLCIDKVIAAETSWEFALTSGAVGVVIALTEMWSFLASLLILFPTNPFLRMFQKALIGEIASKLKCDESEVEKILKDSVRRRKVKRQPRAQNGQFTPKKK